LRRSRSAREPATYRPTDRTLEIIFIVDRCGPLNVRVAAGRGYAAGGVHDEYARVKFARKVGRTTVVTPALDLPVDDEAST